MADLSDADRIASSSGAASTAAALDERTLYRRAVEAVIWGCRS